ncbi:DUF1214 domain-containing protein [Sphingomonas cavernae]|uniref:DUF1214 domain-containing protein n=1 Tax=Sphingomonas cavernae TaxID=2320861 RepID=A0A418WMQ9_9SPHN|nr:DUF1214 domain-containing protein [Sphingomonas cavernae]RJF91286.1 DUF1214 domain-containing protein [Sphingomonas cavernae]
MAFGDGTDDEALRAGWEQFCDRLRAAGDQVFKDHNPSLDLHRADAFRFLTQNLGQAFDLALETRDPRYPHIHAFCTPFRKLGADAADFTYQQAWIDGESAYRITGAKGTARFFNITVQGPRPETQSGTGWPSLHEPFGDVPEANLFGHQIETAPDGSFELFVGGPERACNWLPTTPGSRKLFIRQGFDRWDETHWTLRIERIGMVEPRPMPTPAEMIGAFDWAGEFVTGLMRDWPDHPYLYSGGAVDPASMNRFPPLPSSDAGDGKRGRAVANMVWALAPDEALVVSFKPGDGFWMASLGGVFMNSLDYLYRPVSYTPSRARTDSDGHVRLILCAEDPGFHNWMDTSGFEQGNLAIRMLMSASGPAIETRLVKRADLSDLLPADSARATPEARHVQFIERFRGIQRQRLGL